MSLNQYCNKFLLVILFSIAFGKILIPELYSNSPETLLKKNKYRDYYEIDKTGLEYTVEGPVEIKIFSKAAFPKRTINESKEFNFNISINKLETSSDNLKRIDYKTFSSSHPMHVYTYSAKDILVLPSGTYNIRIYQDFKWESPILIRVSKSGRKSKNIVKEEVNLGSAGYSMYNNGLYNNNRYEIKGNNTLAPLYYILDSNNSLFLPRADELLEFNLRSLHDSVDDSFKIINLTLEKNGKFDTQYHIFCVPHPSKTIIASNKIPGRLNKIYVQNKDNYYELKLEAVDANLLIRPNRILN